MRSQILRSVLPLTLISFSLLSQWSFCQIEDYSKEYFHGFPLVYKCRGFHTSLSSQYFAIPYLVDLICYFSFWFVFIFCISRITAIKIPRKLVNTFWITYGFFVYAFVFLFNELDDRLLLDNPYDIEILENGLSLLGTHPWL